MGNSNLGQCTHDVDSPYSSHTPITDRTTELERILEQRVMIMDGSWGVMLQSQDLSESDYRGDRFAHHTHDLKGCIDVLVLTQPDLIRDVQGQYLDAGADILTTNTFTATRYGLSEFGLAGPRI